MCIYSSSYHKSVLSVPYDRTTPRYHNHDAGGRCALTYYISASDLSRFSEWQLCCLFSAVHLVNERQRSRIKGSHHTPPTHILHQYPIFTHENCLNHDLCSIVFFWFGYTGMGLLRGAAERKKLVAAAALIEIESLPFVEKSSVS